MAPRNAPEPVYIVRNNWTHFYAPVPACDLRAVQREQVTTMPHRQLKGPAPAHWCSATRQSVEPVQRRHIPDFKGRRQPILKPATSGHAGLVRDAIEEGEDLARARVVLPWNAEHGLPRTPPSSWDWEARWLRQGYHFEEEEDEDEWLEPEGTIAAGGFVVQEAGFSMECLPRSEETYTVRTKVRKRRAVPDDEKWDVVSIASACSFVKL
jgi:hypothetical protein